MITAALIVAAGRGTRAGAGQPKQWREMKGRRVIDWTIEAFRRAEISPICLVLNPEDKEAWESFAAAPDIILASGGVDRAGSVLNGLIALASAKVDFVLIHDAARPCVTPDLIHSVRDRLRTCKAAAPALPVADALWTGAQEQVIGAQDRAGLYAAQTPQGFDFETILAAHRAHSGPALDDVEVARAAGHPVAIVPGEADNIKITRPEDFARAARILGSYMDIRLGNGFDVHRFGEGDHVVLCGVQIPHDRGLQGHSDADVGMHAVTDAIYGALARGDIGQHFPPSDPQWKGASSDIFLTHAVEMASEMEFQISNVDCTLICEYPKIGPHAETMRQALAAILRISVNRVSVKATTSERLGFTGRKEGIAAIATATLVTV